MSLHALFSILYYIAYARKSKALEAKKKNKKRKNSIFIDEKIYSVGR